MNLEDADTVDAEEQRHQEAQAWMEYAKQQKGSLANVVDIFKRYVEDANVLKQYVLRAQEDLAACQQELVACKNSSGLYRNFLTLNGIDLKSGQKQGGRKSRKKRKTRRRKTRRRKTRRRKTRRRKTR